MEYKILESNGVEISNVDGAVFNNFSASNQDGVLAGVLNECIAIIFSSDTVQIATGELLIHGFRVKITSPYTITKPSNLANIDYYLIARITLTEMGDVTFDIEARQTDILTQNDLFRTGSGTYEIELCRFVVGSSGITNLNRTVKVISGSTSDSTNSYTKEETDERISEAINNAIITVLNTDVEA